MKLIAKTPLHLEKWFSSDAKLHQLYPKSIRTLARMHWSPLYVIQKVITYLASNDKVKVLDIGSGVGTFCLAGAFYKSSVDFFGVEQRKSLVDHAESVRKKLGFQNVQFIHRNFTQINLNEFDHFYFYNSFFENLDGTDKIDNEIAYSNDLYNYYSIYLYNQLERMPQGTKVATYCSWGDEIPPGYRLAETHFNNLLKFWIKM
jgi:hypothetical protein